MTRQAHVSRDGDGDALGCSIFINAEELAELGVNLQDANKVQYSVSDGQLRVEGGDAG